MDAGFARTDQELRELRREVWGSRTELKGDIEGLRAELKGDIEGLRTVMLRFGVAIVICLAGVIATLIGVIATGSVSG
ncbi:MAG TPA: hypothetical protein VHF90_05290 [Thermoleophilaceae bacterium]|nr:hypothetical protein [Thermoleophilaceae bacterium]